MQGSWLRRQLLLICCLGAVVLLVMMSSFLGRANVSGEMQDPESAGSLQVTTTPTYCPVATQVPPPLVEPLISPTSLFAQTVVVYAYASEAITVTSQAGVFAVYGDLGDWSNPARIDIRLLRNETHNLTAYSKVPAVRMDCTKYYYIMSTSVDRNGNPLIIEQVSPELEYKTFLPVCMQLGGLRE